MIHIYYVVTIVTVKQLHKEAVLSSTFPDLKSLSWSYEKLPNIHEKSLPLTSVCRCNWSKSRWKTFVLVLLPTKCTVTARQCQQAMKNNCHDCPYRFSIEKSQKFKLRSWPWADPWAYPVAWIEYIDDDVDDCYHERYVHCLRRSHRHQVGQQESWRVFLLSSMTCRWFCARVRSIPRRSPWFGCFSESSPRQLASPHRLSLPTEAIRQICQSSVKFGSVELEAVWAS